MRLKLAVLTLLVATLAYQFLLPAPWPGADAIQAQVEQWRLGPEQRKWEAIRWTENPVLAFEQARKLDRPLFVFRSAAPFSRG